MILIAITSHILCTALGGTSLPAAAECFLSNELRYEDTLKHKPVDFSAELLSVNFNDGKTWLRVSPFLNLKGISNVASNELMGSSFYVSVGKANAMKLGAGDIIRVRAKLGSIERVFRDRIEIYGSSYNGSGSISGGTVTVSCLVWSLPGEAVTRTQSLKEREKVQAVRDAIEAKKRAWKDSIEAMFTAASGDDVPALELALRKGLDVNQLDEDGRSPLMNAARNGCYRTVAFLLAHPSVDKNKKTKNGDTALDFAYESENEMLPAFMRERGCK